MCASHWARTKPKGEVKSKAGPRGLARVKEGGWAYRPRGGAPHSRGVPFS